MFSYLKSSYTVTHKRKKQRTYFLIVCASNGFYVKLVNYFLADRENFSFFFVCVCAHVISIEAESRTLLMSLITGYLFFCPCITFRSLYMLHD